jgi:hypothetical protein
MIKNYPKNLRSGMIKQPGDNLGLGFEAEADTLLTYLAYPDHHPLLRLGDCAAQAQPRAAGADPNPQQYANDHRYCHDHAHAIPHPHRHGNPDDYTDTNRNSNPHADTNAYIHPNTHVDAKPNVN